MNLASLTPRRLRIGLIGVPMALALAYFTLIAAPRYQSESIVSVNMASVQPTVLPGMISATGMPTPLQFEDTLFLMYYIQSASALKAADARLQLRAHYASPRFDFIGRLWRNASAEWFLWYWQQRVLLSFDDQSGLLTIDVQAFDRDTAYRLQRTILELSERWVNDYSWKIARDQIAFAQKLGTDARAELQKTKVAVADFQAHHHLLDPVAESQAASGLVASLQATLAQQEAALNSLASYVRPQADLLQNLRSQIAATQRQLATERARATGGARGDPLSQLNIRYSDLLLDETLAYNNYLAAAAALQAARIDASRKLKSLVVVEEATRPDSAEYPKRFYDLLTLAVVCVLLYTVTRLTLAAILEHRD